MLMLKFMTSDLDLHWNQVHTVDNEHVDISTAIQ